MIQFHTNNPQVILPTKSTPFSVGYDFTNNFDDIILQPNNVFMYKSEIKVRLPQGWFLWLKERSSWGKKGLITTAGIIDPDYIEDEIGICICNVSDHPLIIPHGERFVQGIPIQSLVPMLNTFDRGGGFGSTGK